MTARPEAAPEGTLPAGALRRTALFAQHQQAGARFAPFAGWEMPIQYAGILAEHEAVRTGVGVFDVSHMGRVRIDGPDAGARIRSVTTFDVASMQPGEAHYSLYCNTHGGIDDDIFVYRINADRWLIVHNAANAEPDFTRVAAAAPAAIDVTAATVMLAVQGPRAMRLAAALFGARIDALAPRTCVEVEWHGTTVLLARTGYTGEDGVECILDASAGAALWDALLAGGAVPCGLGARDTLRLEAALPLHGSDIDATTTPYEARLGWAVTLGDGRPFTGRDALESLAAAEPARRLSAIRLLEHAGVPRHGYPVLDPAHPGIAPVAALTSGAFSPTLRGGIAMAYLPPGLQAPGTPLAIEIRGRTVPAETVRRPFYRRSE